MSAVDESVMELGRVVRALRRSKGWTQARLAAEAGVGRDALVKLENGSREPRPATLDKVGRVLEADLYAVLREGAMRLARSAPATKPARAGGHTPEYTLALASRPAAEGDESGERGADEQWTLVGILGGAEALEDLGRALEEKRAQDLSGVGLADYPGAPRLAPGEGAADEIVAQRRARYY